MFFRGGGGGGTIACTHAHVHVLLLNVHCPAPENAQNFRSGGQYAQGYIMCFSVCPSIHCVE